MRNCFSAWFTLAVDVDWSSATDRFAAFSAVFAFATDCRACATDSASWARCCDVSPVNVVCRLALAEASPASAWLTSCSADVGSMLPRDWPVCTCCPSFTSTVTSLPEVVKFAVTCCGAWSVPVADTDERTTPLLTVAVRTALAVVELCPTSEIRKYRPDDEKETEQDVEHAHPQRTVLRQPGRQPVGVRAHLSCSCSARFALVSLS